MFGTRDYLQDSSMVDELDFSISPHFACECCMCHTGICINGCCQRQGEVLKGLRSAGDSKFSLGFLILSATWKQSCTLAEVPGRFEFC